MKKFLVNIASFWIVFFLMWTCFPMKSSADEQSYFAENYEYTVRIFSGGQGTFHNGSTQMTIKVPYGTVLDFSELVENVVVTPTTDAAGNEKATKYYAKGIRESGKDNRTIGSFTIQKINKDMDYVVAYAMKGGDIAYTVRYLENGTDRELLPPQVFYGNKGEKPVVAYRHIDGYVPQAYSLSKTLQEDETLNVFSFYYEPGDETIIHIIEKDGGTIFTEVDGGTIEEHIPGKVVTIPGETGVRVIAATNKKNTRNNNGGNANLTLQEENEQREKDAENQFDRIEKAPTVEVPPVEVTPEPLIDLDDPEVPMAPSTNILSKDNLHVYLTYATILCQIIVLIGAFVYMRLRKKKKYKIHVESLQSEENDEEVLEKEVD